MYHVCVRVCVFGGGVLTAAAPATVELTETEEGSAYTSECIYGDFMVIYWWFTGDLVVITGDLLVIYWWFSGG